MLYIKIIAEIGCNFDSIDQAKEMIKRSKEVGCCFSKFQLFTSKEAQNLPEHLYLTFDQAKELFRYGKSIKQEVFFTPMYIKAIDICEQIGVSYYKIRYKDRYNLEIVRKILDTNKPFFISFDQDDFHLACINRFPKQMFEGMPLLCVPKYPASFEDYNGIITFGYSDHTPDFRLLKYAKNNNALWFEKHMKLEGTEPLEDKWSISFKELEEVLKKNER